MSNLIIALVVTVLILGGPFTLFAAIKLLNALLAAPKAHFAKTQSPNGPMLSLVVSWDNESFDREIYRIRIDAQELVRGGRSASFSYTFPDKSSKKKSFVVPLAINADDLALLTDAGLKGDARAVDRTKVLVEIETTNNETTRISIPKRKLREVMAQGVWTADKSFDTMAPTAPDTWSLLTRVFPWKKEAELKAAVGAGTDVATTGKAKPAAAKGASAAPAIADFIVTKVWIEPGCIVCDACENEAPEVFHVLPDTCVVRENAPLGNALSIRAAAEGCPVDVIKYTTAPKPA